MGININAFIALMKHPVKFRMFLFTKVPAAFFSGLRVEDITPERCAISVPFKWFNQNPFRSTYFASLSMAAEMSTGALAMAYLYKLEQPVSMLVTSIEGKFLKKAVGKTIFTCEEGSLFAEAVERALNSNEGQTVRAHSIGVNKAGEPIAEFFVSWSFKRKSGIRVPNT